MMSMSGMRGDWMGFVGRVYVPADFIWGGHGVPPYATAEIVSGRHGALPYGLCSAIRIP